MEKKYYFVVIKKYGDIYDVFNFERKQEMQDWKKKEREMYSKEDLQFIYTSYVPETWKVFELKKEDWGI